MKKRGQSSGVAIQVSIGLAIVFLIIIISFGIKFINHLDDKACQAQLVEFSLDLKDLENKVDRGETKQFQKKLPCKADRLYIFDRNKFDNDFLNAHPDFFKIEPLVMDSITEADFDHNVFLTSNEGELITSFYGGDLKVTYPYYYCMLSKNSKIDYTLEKQGFDTYFYAGCSQPECTRIPIEPVDMSDADDIIELSSDAKDKDSNDCSACADNPDNPVEELVFMQNTNQNVKLYRRYKACRQEEKTNVEIIIKPKEGTEVDEFRFYEHFPKSSGCIDNLNEVALKLEELAGVDISVNADPLIVWYFKELTEEQKISYEIESLLTDECKEKIEGIGIAEAITEIKTSVPVGESTPPQVVEEIIEKEEKAKGEPKEDESEDKDVKIEFSFSDVKELKPDDNWHNVLDLKKAVTYKVEDVEANNKDITFVLVDGGSEVAVVDKNDIECRIKSNDKQVECKTDEDKGDISFTVKATDVNGVSDTGSFTVGVVAGEENKKAELKLEFTDIEYKKLLKQHTYEHTRLFTETKGVGVTLTNGELCIKSEITCKKAEVNYRIEAGKTFSFQDTFTTNNNFNSFTLTYDGVDDNGNQLSVTQTLKHPLKN